MRLKMSVVKWCPFRHGLNMLSPCIQEIKSWLSLCLAMSIAPCGARTSTGTALKTKLNIFLCKVCSIVEDLELFFLTWYIAKHEKSQWDLVKSHSTSSANWLWTSDATWGHKIWSTSVQVMACCMAAPSHYPSPCWQIITEAFIFYKYEFE